MTAYLLSNRNLQKAESKMEKLGALLSEVDRKVAGLRDKFEKVRFQGKTWPICVLGNNVKQQFIYPPHY